MFKKTQKIDISSRRVDTINIGDGKLRELMSEAANKEKSGQLTEAAASWEAALRNIDYSKKDAIQKETYITNRIAYCKTWGLRLRGAA